MKNRVISEDANEVSLFPFLAVLLCTMGALLVLLVVLAQRAAERVVAEANASPAASPALQQALRENHEEAAEIERQLTEVRAYQRQLANLRKQAEVRLSEEQQRLSHLEEHTRRLEHELARLSLAAQQLEATEKNRVVDQQQSERELARLQQLIQDTEMQLDELREESKGKRSYAIVPYKGPNGTYRKPVYIECRKDGIIIHPEGIRLEARDFFDPSWPGNPLAAALRATRTHLNEQAAKAGAPEPPDPYPLILIRPDGVRQYRLARAAITSWDANFGYEFISSDWKLSFPEEADPQLARIQQHAILLARDQLERLVRSAPSRFRGMRSGGSGSGASGGRTGSNGFGDGSAEGEFAEGTQLAESKQGGSAAGNGFAGNQSTADAGTENGDGADSGETQGETQYGALAGEGSPGTDEGGTSDEFVEGTEGAGGDRENTNSGDQGDRYAQSNGSSATGGEGNPGGTPSGSAAGSAASGSTASGGSRGASSSSGSIADSKGKNWAVEGGRRGSVPIRRTIHVVVRQNQLAFLPSRHALEGAAAKGQVIQLNQSQRQISDEFVAALQTRIKDWGLAGNGLYWRPQLKLNVGPGAEQTAEQVKRLLKNSGVELSLPETARAGQKGALDAPR